LDHTHDNLKVDNLFEDEETDLANLIWKFLLYNNFNLFNIFLIEVRKLNII